MTYTLRAKVRDAWMQAAADAGLEVVRRYDNDSADYPGLFT